MDLLLVITEDAASTEIKLRDQIAQMEKEIENLRKKPTGPSRTIQNLTEKMNQLELEKMKQPSIQQKEELRRLTEKINQLESELEDKVYDLERQQQKPRRSGQTKTIENLKEKVNVLENEKLAAELRSEKQYVQILEARLQQLSQSAPQVNVNVNVTAAAAGQTDSYTG